MIPTHKPCRPRIEREYRGIPDRDLPIRYKPRDSCYIGIAAPKEDVPAYRATKPEHDWNWPKRRQGDAEEGEDD